MQLTEEYIGLPIIMYDKISWLNYTDVTRSELLHKYICINLRLSHRLLMFTISARQVQCMELQLGLKQDFLFLCHKITQIWFYC